MIFNLHQYIRGTVTVKVSGQMPEKFINLCMMEKKNILSISKRGDDFIICMGLKDFLTIRPIVRKSQSRVRVIGYWGLPFVTRKIKRRKMLVVGAVLFLFIINTLMSYIWFVDIVGMTTLSTKQIKDCVYQYGLKPGVLRDSVSAKFIENQILLALPEVAWVSINFTGTRAVIEIVEKTVPNEIDKSPANIIAVKDGMITEVIVLAGQSAVKKGDMVKKGDILIKGAVYDAKDSPQGTNVNLLPTKLIRANGIVKAKVWYEGYAETELVKSIPERNGNKMVGITVKILGYEVNLKPVTLDTDKTFEVETVNKKISIWRNSDIAVESIISTYYEMTTKVVEISVEEAREHGKAVALSEVQSLIPETAQVLLRTIEVLKTPETNLVRIKVNIETAEDIGQFMNIP